MQELRGQIFTSEGKFEPGIITVVGDKTDSVEMCNASQLDDYESDRYIIPGLVDIHIHGANGHDVCSSTPDGLRSIVAYEKEHGVTSICLATMTLEENDLHKVLHSIAEVNHPNIKGVYLEGPFISAKKCGAQAAEYIVDPDIELLNRLQVSAKGMIKIVVIAPETPGALNLIKKSGNDFVFSVGHTDADYVTASRAFELGAKHVTHLYNAMSSFGHRSPGVVGAAADKSRVTVELIADGIHIHPSVVKSTFKIFEADRVCLVSDSTEAAGMPNGDYVLGNKRIHVSNKWALLEDGTLAGSASNLYDCMQSAIKMGIPKEHVVKACTDTPAKVIGMENKVGSLLPGRNADILIMDHDFKLEQVIQCEDDILG